MLGPELGVRDPTQAWLDLHCEGHVNALATATASGKLGRKPASCPRGSGNGF